MSKLLEIKDIYGGYEAGINVLQGISLSVEHGEAIGIIGLNGSGKSTLGKVVMNLLPFRSGSVIFEGKDISTVPTFELAQMGIAMMHQGGVVFPNLSVWQNLQLAFCNAHHSVLDTQLKDLIPLLQKPKKELMQTMADKLSGGQRHELALAMTLARQPKLIILDEPSAGLSPKAVEEMYEMVEGIRHQLGTSLLLVEQNIALALSFCDAVLLLSQGQIVDCFEKGISEIMKIESIMFNSKCYETF